jgi:hypothetical protein
MSNARTRRNRRAGIAAKAVDAYAVDAQWRVNPMMRPDIASKRGHTFNAQRESNKRSAYRWDGQAWVADEARERKVVRTEFDTPLLPEVARARRDGMAGVRWIENQPIVNRSTDDSAMRSKPAKRQLRGGGDEVETWASKGK